MPWNAPVALCAPFASVCAGTKTTKERATLHVLPNFGHLQRWLKVGRPVFGTDSGLAAARLGRSAPVLIVEDDHLVAMDLETVLLDAGLDVVGIAATAEDAVALAHREKPDLVIMDIRLASARDGVEAALDLFRDLGLRCIFATAHQDAATRLRAQPAHPLGWLSKPYQPSALLQTVQHAFDDLSKE